MENQWDRYGFMETYVENHYLVGGLEHDFIFPYMGNFIIPTGELMFFRGVGIPPTFCLGLPPHFPNFSLEQITNPKKPPTSFCFLDFCHNLLTC